MSSRFGVVEGETPYGNVWLISDSLSPWGFTGVAYPSREFAQAWVDANNEKAPITRLAEQYSIVEDSDE